MITLPCPDSGGVGKGAKGSRKFWGSIKQPPYIDNYDYNNINTRDNHDDDD